MLCVCRGCDGCCVFCLHCEAWSCRCSCMGSVSVSSCKCLCASCGSSPCCVLYDFQFVNAARGILQSRSHNCFVGCHECLLFTPSCCNECFLMICRICVRVLRCGCVCCMSLGQR